MSEDDAIAAWKQGDQRAGARLCEMHSGLIYSSVRRYVTDRVELEDLLQVGRMALLRAATLLDVSKAGLSTYAVLKMRSWARNYSRKNRYVVSVSEAADRVGDVRPYAVWLDAPFGDGGDTIGSCFSVPANDTRAAVDTVALVESLPARERGVLLRLCADETLQQIGDSMGVSKQRVGKIKTDAVAMLRRRMAA